MNVFVTGSSGYLGSLLIDQLAILPEVDAITGIDLTPPQKPLPPKAVFQHFDIRDPELCRAMVNHHVVVHLACVVKWPRKMPKAVLEDINVNGVRNVARAAAAGKVQRFIQISSIAAYQVESLKGATLVREDAPLGDGNSSFYYADTKAKCEHALREIIGPTDTRLTILRPSIVVGERLAELLGFLREKAVRLRGKNPRLQLVHEEDLASAVVQAVLTDMPGAYNVVPDDWLCWNEILQIVGRRSPPTISVWLACFFAGTAWRFSGSTMHSSWIRALCKDLTLSNVKLKETGWVPRHSTKGVIIAALGQTLTDEPTTAAPALENLETIGKR
jgi:UDP-glucose 4-epimerase